MPWHRWVLDATMGAPFPGGFCFCPLEGDLDGEYAIVTGMNYLGDAPPSGTVVAVVHADGQEACDAFYAEHKEAIDGLLAANRAGD
jgi:hypothetical protein